MSAAWKASLKISGLQNRDWIVLLALGSLLIMGERPMEAIDPEPLYQTADRYVATTGVDSGDCSGSPCKTIKYAISKAVSGDIIDVAAGTYTESAINLNKNLKLSGAGIDKTILQAASQSGKASNRVLSTSSNITASIEKMTIRYGKSNYGSGVLIGSSGNVTINTVKITENSAVVNSTQDGVGGGIFVDTSGKLTLANSVINKNTATGSVAEGGGIFAYCYTTVIINNSKITGNSAKHGGGIATFNILTLTNSDVSNNYAEFGGGGLNISGTTVISNSTISNNGGSVGTYGGGIFNSGSSTLTIVASEISNNGAMRGGGISNSSTGILTINKSTLLSNKAYHGGGIENNGSSLIIKNSTLAKNYANWGGAIYNSGSLTISFTTIAESDSNPSEVAGIYNYGTLNVKSSIIGKSQYGDDCLNNGGTINASGVNLTTGKTCKGFTTVSTTQLGLGSLQLNSPGTTKTYALSTGSSAINTAGDCLDYYGNAVTTDQRGVTRPSPSGGKCDIGSYERSGSSSSPQFLFGDVNFDRIVNVIDARMIELVFSGSATLDDDTLKLADIDQNGVIDNLDSTLTAKIGIGLRLMNQYSLEIQKGGPGEGTVTSQPSGIDCGSVCSSNFPANQTVTLTGTAEKGYILSGWEGCDQVTSQKECVVKMDQARTVIAIFDLQSGSILPTLSGIAEEGNNPIGISSWLLFALFIPGLVRFPRIKSAGRQRFTLLLAVILGLMVFTACTPQGQSPVSSEEIISISSTKLSREGNGALEITVRNISEGGGIASLQGRIIFDPGLIQVQWMVGTNGFVIKAMDIDNERGVVRFALVKPSEEGISNGSIASIIIQAVGTSTGKTLIKWEGTEETRVIAGGDNNQELIGFGLADGEVIIR